MRSRLAVALLIAALVASAPVACGEEQTATVTEGIPTELDGIEYTVVITRFLNPDDPEDAAYLDDQRPPPPDQLYLGVFLQVENVSDEAAELPPDMSVVDTVDNHYRPVESESPYALNLGQELQPGAELPAADTTAETGPIQGAMVLFLIDDASTENRPLELEIPSGSVGDPAIVELDI